MILLLGNVRSSVMEDVKETEIGLLAKKNVNNPVVTFLYIENDSNNILIYVLLVELRESLTPLNLLVIIIDDVWNIAL